jgi:hypothetical protein
MPDDLLLAIAAFLLLLGGGVTIARRRFGNARRPGRSTGRGRRRL